MGPIYCLLTNDILSYIRLILCFFRFLILKCFCIMQHIDHFWGYLMKSFRPYRYNHLLFFICVFQIFLFCLSGCHQVSELTPSQTTVKSSGTIPRILASNISLTVSGCNSISFFFTRVMITPVTGVFN